MTIQVSVTDSEVFASLRSFLLGILPSGTEVVLAQDNRVPEPEGENFVTMTPLRRPRLSTNVDTNADAKFTGSIAGTVMTITEVDTGSLSVGRTIFGVGVANNTTVISFGTGTGGVGTYNISPSQTVDSTTLSAGATLVTQSTEMVVQLDVHGPASADNSQVISTLFRDQYAVAQFEALGGFAVPLYCDEPKQIPFQNAEQQYETRYVIDAHLQLDPTVSIPQQYADAANVTVVSVEAAFPPS